MSPIELLVHTGSGSSLVSSCIGFIISFTSVSCKVFSQTGKNKFSCIFCFVPTVVVGSRCSFYSKDIYVDCVELYVFYESVM